MFASGPAAAQTNLPTICPAAGDEGLRCPSATSSQQAGPPDREGARAVHIPDGYLSPQTCAVMYGAAVPVLGGGRAAGQEGREEPLRAAPRHRRRVLLPRDDVQHPDPGRDHRPRGRGVLIAVLLGPWAAVIAVSIALLIQALFFGDGGVLAYGANVVNMAVIMPFVGYGVYRTLARRTSLTSPKRAAGGRAWAPTSASTPRRWRRPSSSASSPTSSTRLSASGAKIPLYAPFHLSQTIPAMLFAHLVVAGVVDGRADRRRRRLPAAGQPAAAAHQPRRRARDRRRPPAAAQARLPVGLRRAGGDGCARAPRACWPPAPPSARTARTTSTSRGTG